jgi:hypothetical protein
LISNTNLEPKLVSIAREIIANYRSQEGFYFGGYFVHEDTRLGFWSLTIETNRPEYIGDIVEWNIKQGMEVNVWSSEVHPGMYDWGSGLYIKDCVVLTVECR